MILWLVSGNRKMDENNYFRRKKESKEVGVKVETNDNFGYSFHISWYSKNSKESAKIMNGYGKWINMQ